MSIKKNIAYWALYDFANSIVMIAFLFYFSQWLVVDQGNPSWWFNISLMTSSLLFILTAPFLSKKIDATGEKIAGLRLWSMCAMLGFAAVSLIALFSDSLDGIATVIYTLSLYAYLICFVYFTPMLSDLSHEGNHSFISGIGQGANSVGQVAGLLITIPFVSGAVTLFGDSGRAQALLPATIIFALLSLPMLLLYRESETVGSKIFATEASPVSLWELMRGVFSHKRLAFILVAFFLFSDALLTFGNNFPLFLEKVHGVNDTTKALLTAAILVLAALGAVVFGKIADRFGALKTLLGILIAWCFIFPAMAFAPDFNILVGIMLFAGICYGPVWGISRSLVGQTAPTALVASSYGYYVVAERFATFLGPLTWSGIILLAGDDALGYRWALLSMAVLVIGSVFVLRKARVTMGAL